jgi:hypothetical protein
MSDASVQTESAIQTTPAVQTPVVVDTAPPSVDIAQATTAGVPPDDNFMLIAANNVIKIYEANESEKVGSLKYFGALITAIISMVIAITRFGKGVFQEDLLIATLLFIQYFVGIVILRKLFSIRKTTVVLSVELGNIYRYFGGKYPSISGHIGKSFKLWDNTTNKINKGGSDYFNFIMIAIVNTSILIASCMYFVYGLEKYLISKNLVVYADHTIMFLESVIIAMNVILFMWFKKLTDH